MHLIQDWSKRQREKEKRRAEEEKQRQKEEAARKEQKPEVQEEPKKEEVIQEAEVQEEPEKNAAHWRKRSKMKNKRQVAGINICKECAVIWKFEKEEKKIVGKRGEKGKQKMTFVGKLRWIDVKQKGYQCPWNYIIDR